MENHWKKLVAVIIFVWRFGIIVPSLFAIQSTTVIQGYCYMAYNYPNENIKRVAEIIYMTIFILIPLCVMIFCYSHIYIAIKRQSKSFGDGNLSSSENVRERRMIKAKVNIFKTMVVVCLCYFSCWILNAIVVHLIFCQFPTLEVHSMMSLLTWHFLIAALIHLSTLSNIEIFKMLLRYCLVRMISRKMLQPHCHHCHSNVE